MPTVIRFAAAADADLLTKLCADVHESHFAERPDEFKPFSSAEVAAWFRTLLAEPTSRVWIAECEGRAVGFIAASVHVRPETPLVRAQRRLEIDQISVVPEFRRRGVARDLIRAAEEAARRERLTSLQMTTWCFNSVAREAMTRLGFRPKVVRFERATDELTAQPPE